ncbi:hypothetical protein [Rhizobium leguminosarum]|uniref:amino acid kinase family protein n=1 Tax=Rhizobium leguminosarum TaxID=384 RepID=UPI0028C51136|nr:hypothetical protein [Rhizobium leguminosarum]
MDQSRRLTFLGRNSSDLTAVVTAAMWGEQASEIYSDVKSVYTADPNLCPKATIIPEDCVPDNRADVAAWRKGRALACRKIVRLRCIVGRRDFCFCAGISDN